MGILQRFSDIMRSNINAALDRAEDPAKLVDQYLLDAKKNLAEVKKETASVLANERAAQRAVETCRENIEEYGGAARNAVKAGNDGDARKLLERKQQEEQQLAGLEKNLEAAREQSARMRQLYDKLTDDIRSLESRRDTVKAKAATAKAQEAVNRAGSRSVRGRDVDDAFSRMEDRTDRRLDEAMAAADLDGGGEDGLLAQYAGGGSSSVDEELARLKAEMDGET